MKTQPLLLTKRKESRRDTVITPTIILGEHAKMCVQYYDSNKTRIIVSKRKIKLGDHWIETGTINCPEVI
jgi:hypothetical protein